jgi:chorismate mutase
LDEINRLLAETEEELAKLSARRAELLAQVSELRKEEASILCAGSTTAAQVAIGDQPVLPGSENRPLP